jgi:arylsulfatase A-like enzyme
VCSPSRATLLTGRIPSQHGVHDWIREGNVGANAIRYLEGELTYTDLMARRGWTCLLSGKWHLGDSQIPQHGFTHWFAHQRGGGPYNDAPMVRNGQCVSEPGYVTHAITNEALMLIDRCADLNIPFYLSVHYTAPHSPWTGHPQDIVDSYDDCPFNSCPQEPRHPWATELTDQCLGNREMLKGYFAAVTAMDADVGRILDKLAERGLRENTLVVFMSDNGFSCGHHGFWGKGNGTNPRNMYENSIKVPAIFSHPGVIPPGRAESAMVSAYDFMPTLLDYLGLPIPTDRNLPGVSFLPILRGEEMDQRENVVIFDEYGPVRMIRTKEWKYVYRHAYGPHELYDLVNDPDERVNLAADPAQAQRIRELKAAMDEWFARYVNPHRDGLNQDGTAMGQTTYLPPA